MENRNENNKEDKIKMTSYLEITFGPMFSGKTTNLIHKIHTYLDIHSFKGKKKTGLIINYSKDNRDIQKCGNLTTHSSSKKEINPNIKFLSVTGLNHLNIKELRDVDYIAIDEAQFYPDLQSFVGKLLEMKKHVHVSGLVADSDKRKFGNIIDLIPLADNVEQLKAYCVDCKDHYQNAPFTKCCSTKDSQVLIGAQDKYKPVCGFHYS